MKRSHVYRTTGSLLGPEHVAYAGGGTRFFQNDHRQFRKWKGFIISKVRNSENKIGFLITRNEIGIYVTKNLRKRERSEKRYVTYTNFYGDKLLYFVKGIRLGLPLCFMLCLELESGLGIVFNHGEYRSRVGLGHRAIIYIALWFGIS